MKTGKIISIPITILNFKEGMIAYYPLFKTFGVITKNEETPGYVYFETEHITYNYQMRWLKTLVIAYTNEMGSAEFPLQNSDYEFVINNNYVNSEKYIEFLLEKDEAKVVQKEEPKDERIDLSGLSREKIKSIFFNVFIAGYANPKLGAENLQSFYDDWFERNIK